MCYILMTEVPVGERFKYRFKTYVVTEQDSGGNFTSVTMEEGYTGTFFHNVKAPVKRVLPLPSRLS